MTLSPDADRCAHGLNRRDAIPRNCNRGAASRRFHFGTNSTAVPSNPPFVRQCNEPVCVLCNVLKAAVERPHLMGDCIPIHDASTVNQTRQDRLQGHISEAISDREYGNNPFISGTDRQTRSYNIEHFEVYSMQDKRKPNTIRFLVCRCVCAYLVTSN